MNSATTPANRRADTQRRRSELARVSSSTLRFLVTGLS